MTEKELFKQIINGTIKRDNGNIIRPDQIGLYIKRYYPEIFENKGNMKFSEYVYITLYGKDNFCINCGKETKFNTLNKGYFKFCSNKCQLKSNHKKFELEGNPMNRPEIKEKQRLNNQEKYGVDYLFQSKEYQNFMEEVCLKRTGFKKASQRQEIKNKISKSNARHYQEYKSDETDKRGFVYILEFKEGIKIGMTTNTNQRFLALIKDFGYFGILKIKEEEFCRKTETKLHKLCDKYNIILSEGAGRTEFFSEDILKIKEIKEYIND